MERTVRPAAGERLVRVSPDDVLVIELPENPTTGYRWDVDQLDEQLFGLETSTYFGQGAAIGAGGMRTIRVRPRGVGRGTIQLKNARVWEPPDKAASRLSLEVEVSSRGG